MPDKDKFFCPKCAQPAAEKKGNPYFPFCSERCKLIDLGKWLDGKYSIPDPNLPSDFPYEDENSNN